jgi:ribosomal protein S12 methylthiotransferase accessory factor
MSHLARGLNTIHVVGIGPEDAIGLALREAFQNVLFSADTPSLFVEIRNNEALIGPLTLANRAGCWRCAFERISAACVNSQPATEQLSPDETCKKITPILIRELQAINTEGLEQSVLLDHVLAVDLTTLDESLHRVIPLASCDVCGGAAAFPAIDHNPVHLSTEDSPEIVLGALAGWVDRRTGVISDLFIEPPDDPRVSLPIIAKAASPYVMEKDGSLHRLPAGWGKGLTISGAVLSAVGEAIERYSASIIDPEKIVWKRPDEIEGEVLHPRDLSLYSDEQYDRDDFPFVRFDSSIPHPWVLGSWLNNAKPVWLPALFVFLFIELHREQLIAQGTSNGLAASSSKDDAALRAILELVERDAFMSTWLTAGPTQRIQLDDTLDPLLRTVLEGIEVLGATVEVYRLPASVIGTIVLCLALGDGEQYPGVTFGLGCDLDPRAALRQAVLELGQTGPYLRRMMRSGVLKPAEDPSGVREMLDHAAYYFPKERASAFDCLRSQETISLRELKSVATRSLEDCAAALNEAGVRVALVDVTSADVATGPFSVMRAVSPNLQPIWYGYGLDRIHGKLKIARDVPPINPIW